MVLVLFDYGEVISRRQAAEDQVGLAEAAGISLEQWRQGYWGQREAYDAGQVDDVQYWQAITQRSVSPEEAAQWARMDAESWLHLNGDVVLLLLELMDAGVPTALLSNAPETIAARVEALPALARMKAKLFSCRIGATKPDPAAYRAALDACGRPADDVVFVDDKPANVRGARDLGLHAVQFRNAERLRRDVRSLVDF